MNAIPIGTSALQVGQRALDLIGQNIANAVTPGYHRQRVDLVNSITGADGTGVDIASITRFTAAPLRTAIISSNADQASFTVQIDTRRQIETTLATGQGGIGDRLENFFNQVEELTGRPDSLASRRAILTSASDLAAQFKATAGDTDRLRADVGNRIAKTVAEVNDLASKIAELNNRILVTENRGFTTNELRDQRDRLIDDLSQRIDIRTVEAPSGEINVIASGAAVVVGQFANTFTLTQDANDQIVITDPGTSQPLTFRAGTLGGLLQDFNTNIPAIRDRLDTVASELIRRVNQIQATGLGTSGPLTSATGTNSASASNVAFNSANLPFAVQPGALTVSVTDTATGNRTTTQISITAATTLDDLATALNGVAGLQASVDPTSNTLQIQGQPGFAFDFAGRDSNPPGSGVVANPDTSGVLVALGLNGLFTGTDATSITVRQAIVADPGLLATSRTGQAGDGTNLERLGAVRDAQAIGTRTLFEDFADIAATLGSEINSLDDKQTTQGAAIRELSNQELAVTGVDSNEELLHLLDYQRLVQSASKYLSVVNTAIDSILAII